MAITCQINLHKPPNAVYRPGDVVSGVITYTLTKPIILNRITTSLKGNGLISIKLKVYNNSYSFYKLYPARETYVDTDYIVTDKNKKVPVGSYDKEFAFKLPENIPSSFLYKNKVGKYKIKCRVRYYIRIKFEKARLLAFPELYQKEIYVAATISHEPLSGIDGPISYEGSMTLLRLFSRRNSVVAIKATIQNSEIPVGGKIQIIYAVNNDTNVTITSISTKLLEVYTFKAKGHSNVTFTEEVPNTRNKTCCLDYESVRGCYLEIEVPIDRVTLKSSKMVNIEYVVRIDVELPLPHRNVILDIPVRIGTTNDIINSNETQISNPDFTALMNWEAMDKARDLKAIDCGSVTRLTFELNENL